MIISLLGYMGSGKSTLGEMLASYLGFSFIDLDDYIVSKEKISVSDIFQKKGEVYFRKVENMYLKEVLEKKDLVVSLGGGTPVYYNNIDLINENSISFYLKMNSKALAERLIIEKNNRPIIAHLKDEEIQEFIAKHLFERSLYYEKATYKIDNNTKTSKDTLLSIVDTLKSNNHI